MEASILAASILATQSLTLPCIRRFTLDTHRILKSNGQALASYSWPFLPEKVASVWPMDYNIR